MKVALSIAGSDSSGGAGIQADLKTFEAFGVFGCSAITVLTAQNTTGVRDIFPVTPTFLKNQIESVFDDFDVNAIKIGMLYSNELIDTVKDFIKNLSIPIVLDPVFISKAGSKLLNDDTIENLKSLFEYATVITPNQYEANQLFGYRVGDIDSLDEILKLNCRVIIKNHKLKINSNQISIDTMYHGRQKSVFDTPFVDNNNYHGTGCSFSSAIAANLALGRKIEESIKISKEFIYQAIANAPNIGSGSGPIAHKMGGEICLNKIKEAKWQQLK